MAVDLPPLPWQISWSETVHNDGERRFVVVNDLGSYSRTETNSCEIASTEPLEEEIGKRGLSLDPENIRGVEAGRLGGWTRLG